MSQMIVYTKFGKVEAKPLQLVNIHDIQPMADEQIDSNSCESNSDKTTTSEVATKPTPSAQEDSSIKSDSDTPTDEQ